MNPTTTPAYQGLFASLKTLLGSEAFLQRHRCRPQDFTRERSLPFVTVMLFLLNLVKRALQDELDEFFKLVAGTEIAQRVVTKSAFSQARQKLQAAAFSELNQTQVAYFYTHLAPATWQGHSLKAVDGSMVNLPNTPAIGEYFGVWHPAAGGTCPKARISQLFDVLNKVTVEARIAPKACGERELAALHFALLTSTDLVLLDRGYPAFWLFVLILSKQAHFCARMKLSGWTVVQEFLASGLAEQIVTVAPGATAQHDCETRQLPSTPITLRLIRIELADGETEVLATSLLDSTRYPVSVFKELYHERWPVEEDYKVMKLRVEVENWSGKSVLAVQQDFHAKVFTKNLAAILAQPAQQVVQQASQGKKYIYQINMTNVLSKLKDTIVLLFQRAAIAPLLEQLWVGLIQTIEPIRPARSVPRVKRVKPKKFPFAYKPTR